MISSSSPTNPHFELMAQRLAEVAVELFAAYDLPIRQSLGASVSNTWSEPSGVATIGYVGEKVRGVLVMVAANTAVEDWMKAAGGGEGETDDALAEFSNMLLGRLKGRLLTDGCQILLASPTTASGAGLRLSMPPGQSKWLVFDGPGWKVSVRLDASFESGFALREVSSEEMPAEAGDEFIF